MVAKVDLSQLKLIQSTFEIRYRNAYALWDKAGLLWFNANSEWSNLKMVKAEPMVTTFTLNDRFELGVNIDRLHIIDTTPSSSLKEFSECAEKFSDIVTNTLNIKNYTRLGFRLIYNRYFPDKITAANTLLASKMLLVPEGKHFNIQGKVLLPQFSLVWEGESTGVKVLMAARDKKIDFDAPLGIEELSSVHIEKYELVYDLDYYTLHQVSKGQLNIKEWIEQAYHLIRRDSKLFLGS